jgi:sporulation protein YlmC with PRC-barrel domain
MKPYLLIMTVVAFSLRALCADTQDSSSRITAQGSSSTSGSSGQEIRFSKLRDANIVSKTGENLGTMEDLMIDPRTGKIRFVILGRGGLLGIGEKYVPVPWKAVNVTSEKEFTINVDKQKLKSAPAVDKQLSELNQPDYSVTVYRFYEIPLEPAGRKVRVALQVEAHPRNPRPIQCRNNRIKSRHRLTYSLRSFCFGASSCVRVAWAKRVQRKALSRARAWLSNKLSRFN